MGSVAWANLRVGSLSIEENDLPSYFYLDAAVAYTFGVKDFELELFFNVRNVLNEYPGIVPQDPTDFTYVSPLSRAGR